MKKTMWVVISRILELILFIMGLWNIWKENWLWVFACFFGFSLAMIPIIIKRSYRFSVHWLIELLLVVAISLHIWGGVLHLYDILFYDTFAHFIAAIIVSFFGLIVVYILDVFSPRVYMDVVMLAFFIIIFTIAMGALWEMAEFAYDFFVHNGTPFAQVSLRNTMLDLIADTAAGIIVGIMGALSIRKGEPKGIFVQLSNETKKLKTNYLKAREEALSSLEKALIEEHVDEKVLTIIDKINARTDFFTTSSCSGRIAIIETPKFGDKKNAHFLGKWHRGINQEEINEALQKATVGELWFLVQSPIFHIASISMEGARKMLGAAIQSGFKHSSLKAMNGKIIIEVLTTERIDTPLGKDGKVYGGEEYLTLLISLANKMLTEMDRKLKRFEKMLDALDVLSNGNQDNHVYSMKQFEPLDKP